MAARPSLGNVHVPSRWLSTISGGARPHHQVCSFTPDSARIDSAGIARLNNHLTKTPLLEYSLALLIAPAGVLSHSCARTRGSAAPACYFLYQGELRIAVPCAAYYYSRGPHIHSLWASSSPVNPASLAPCTIVDGHDLLSQAPGRILL